MSVIYVKYTLNKNNLYNGPTCLDSSYFFFNCAAMLHCDSLFDRQSCKNDDQPQKNNHINLQLLTASTCLVSLTWNLSGFN